MEAGEAEMNVLDRLKYECENGNSLLLLAMADDAEERGEDKLARGFRWLAEEGKWPMHNRLNPNSPKVWAWQLNYEDTPVLRCRSTTLPFSEEIRRTDNEYWSERYATCYEALEAAALAFWPRWKKGRKPRA